MRRYWPAILSLIVLLAVIGFRVTNPSIAANIQNAAFDLYQRLQPRAYQPTPVRVVDIDEASLTRFGQWPWPRDRLAQITARLQAMGAAAIAFDVVFAEPDRTSPAHALNPYADRPAVRDLVARLPDHDRVLAAQIAAGRVVTGFVLTRDAADGDPPATPAGVATTGGDPRPFLPAFRGAVRALPALEAAAAGNGSLNVTPDQDGALRRMPLMMRIGEAIVPTLAAEAVRVAQGEESFIVQSSEAGTGIADVRIGNLIVATDRTAHVRLHYAAAPPQRTIPAWRLLADEIPAAELRGAIVFVGSSAAGVTDLRVGPSGDTLPGVVAHAELAEQILLGSYLLRPEWTGVVETLALIVMWVVFVLLIYRLSVLWSAVAGAVVIVAVCLASWSAFAAARILLDPLSPSLAAIAIYLACSIPRHVQSERQQAWIRKAFSTYISPNLVSHLIANPEALSLGGERRDCTFVLSDLQGFTALVETSDPIAVVNLLNEYLDGMIGIAQRHEGTIDRIVGDAVAVMFSAPVTQPDHAARGIACALEMDRFAQDWAAAKQAEGLPIGVTRIGVNSGAVIVGNVGGQSIYDYRALGDAINTAARLETANAELGTRVLISGATAAAVPGFAGRPVGTLFLKGKTEGIEVFAPDARDTTDAQAYAAAYDLLQKGDPGAAAAIAAVVDAHPDDPLARFHLQRLRQGETGTTIVLQSK